MSDDNVTTSTSETPQTLAAGTTPPAQATPEAPAMNPTEGTQNGVSAGLAPTDDSTQQSASTDPTPPVAVSEQPAQDAISAAATAAAADLPADRTVPGAMFAAALADLDVAEQHALFMGGETGVAIRNAVCRARGLLTGTGV